MKSPQPRHASVLRASRHLVTACWRTIASVLLFGSCTPQAVDRELSAWTLEVEREFTGRHELTQVSSIRVRADGSILVAEPASASILLFGADGTFRRSIGRRGPGPGEFQFLGAIGTLGDSVWGIDIMSSQVSLFDSGGQLIRSWRLQLEAVPPFSQPAGLFPDGAGVLTASRRLGASRGEHLVMEASWDGSRPKTVLRLETSTTEWQLSGGDGPVETSQPLSDDPLYGVSPDGTLFALVDMRSPNLSRDAILVRLAAVGGPDLYVRQVFFPRELVTPTLVDSVVDHKAAQLKLRRIPASAVRNGLYIPRLVPPIATVLVASDSAVWLKAARASAGFDWLVVGKLGSPIGTVRVPSGAAILTIDRGVWGVAPDADGVPHVYRWRVVPERHNEGR